MQTTIKTSNQDGTFHIQKESGHDSYDILLGTKEENVMSFNAEELQEIAKMIEEILQFSNKRDW